MSTVHLGMEALQRPTTPGGSLQLSMAANVVSSADPWRLLVTDIYHICNVILKDGKLFIHPTLYYGHSYNYLRIEPWY